MAQIVPSSASFPPPAGDYRRADVSRLQQPPPGVEAAGGAGVGLVDNSVRWFVIPLSALLCGILALVTVLAENLSEFFFTATLISVLAFTVLFLIVLGVNPVLRLAAAALGRWARPLNRVELICLFTAMMVTSGISTFGLSEMLVPMLAAPNNHETKWNTPASGWDETLVPSLNAKLYIQDRDEIKQFRRGVVVIDSEGRRIPLPRITAPWRTQWAYGMGVYQKIPWMMWIRPLCCWLVFIAACYGIFYSLTYIVLSYWAEREKLIFPLARLSEALLPEVGVGRYRIPAVLAKTGFWLGFAVSFTVWAWNNIFDATLGVLKGTGFEPIPMGMRGDAVNKAIQTSVLFRGLVAPQGGTEGLMFLVMFTAVGIAFLLPLEVSFSVWFYYLMGRVIMLIMIWTGHATSVTALPSDYLGKSNPVTALGGGGILLFSAICLFRCIRDYARQGAGKTLGRRIIIAIPLLSMLACCTVVVMWLRWNNLPVMWGILFVACFLLMTIGLMRLVAESGMYWFQANSGFFHIYNVTGLGKYLAPTLVGPLLPIYSVLFLDIKTFIAPNLLNAADMGKKSHVDRWKFHVNLILCIVISALVAVFSGIFLAHLRGGAALEGWFYGENPPYVLKAAQLLMTSKPMFNRAYTLWFAGGALWVAVSVVLRASYFWFPHPVGFIMLINPLVTQLWFSFFLGWVCKRAVVKYGGKATYDRVRGFFIGLIAGELLASVFWSILGLLTATQYKAIINRYA